MKNRSRTEIAAQILQAAIGGATKTKIMYKGFLSSEQIKEYLALLIENGLLDYDKVTNRYSTTEKGTRFLKIYEQMIEAITIQKEGFDKHLIT